MLLFDKIVQATRYRTISGWLIVRKECWVLTRKAKISLFLMGTIALSFAFWFLYPFLAITQPIHSQILVVEGWLPPETLKYAVAEFNRGDYSEILTSGCTVRERLDMERKITYAEWAASDLRKLGVPENLVQAVPCWDAQRDRTYSSALAIKVWIDKQQLPINTINLMTLGPHGRRSRLLYEEAFRGKVKVGIIAVPSPDYDASHWWRYSEGVRDVIGESIAYLYAKFLFWPNE